MIHSVRSHISYKGETILKMNEKGDKAKSLAASGSSQNIAKTLKMFRDMDAKEQAPPVPQAKLKPGLINEKSKLKIEYKELNDVLAHKGSVESAAYDLRRGKDTRYPWGMSMAILG